MIEISNEEAIVTIVVIVILLATLVFISYNYSWDCQCCGNVCGAFFSGIWKCIKAFGGCINGCFNCLRGTKVDGDGIELGPMPTV